MANIIIKDGNGALKELKSTGAGSTADPFVGSNTVTRNGPQQALVYRSMSLNGATPVTAINRNMNLNGSITPQRFKMGPAAGEIYQLTRMMLAIRDTGTFDSGGWGNNGGSPLTNGVELGMFIGGVEYNMSVVPWRSHIDIAATAFDFEHRNFGAGDEFVVARLTFTKAGQAIRLVGDDGDYVWADINDDLTGLVEQRIMIQGYMEDVYL